MSGEEIILRKERETAIITFNRPEVHNALNNAMVDRLEEALSEIEEETDECLEEDNETDEYSEGAIISHTKDIPQGLNFSQLTPAQRANVEKNQNLGQLLYNEDGTTFTRWTPEYFNSLSEDVLKKMPAEQMQQGLAYLSQYHYQIMH